MRWFLCGALVLVSPGIAPYAAFAQVITGEAALSAVGTVPAAVPTPGGSVAPLDAPGPSVSVSLGSSLFLGSTLETPTTRSIVAAVDTSAQNARLRELAPSRAGLHVVSPALHGLRSGVAARADTPSATGDGDGSDRPGVSASGVGAPREQRPTGSQPRQDPSRNLEWTGFFDGAGTNYAEDPETPAARAPLSLQEREDAVRTIYSDARLKEVYDRSKSRDALSRKGFKFRFWRSLGLFQDILRTGGSPRLSDEERGALVSYDALYLETNEFMRGRGNPWAGSSSAFSSLAKLIVSGLNRLPDFRGTVFRTYWADDSESHRRYVAGRITEEAGFTSATRRRHGVYFPGASYGRTRLRLVIKSHTGKSVGHIMPKPHEQEVLFRPHTRFKVTRKERRTFDLAGSKETEYLIHMEEVPYSYDGAGTNHADDPETPAPKTDTTPKPAAPVPLGKPGPGIRPEHIAGAQRLADETGVPIILFGSRQSGMRQDGTPFDDRSDLNLGVVGAAQDLHRAWGGSWKDIPNVRRGPIIARPAIESALNEGHLVVVPRARKDVPTAPAPKRGLSAAWKRVLGAATAVIALDWATKLIARLVGPPGMPAAAPDPLWNAGSLMLLALPLLGWAIPWAIARLGERLRLGSAYQKTLKRVTSLFPWAVGLLVGAAVTNIVEGHPSGQAIFLGAALMIQLTAYSLLTYAWLRKGARGLYPFGYKAVLFFTALSVLAGYGLAPSQPLYPLVFAWLPGVLVRLRAAATLGRLLLTDRAALWTTASQLERLKSSPRADAEPFEFSVLGDAEPGRFWIWRLFFNRSGVFERQLAAIGKTPSDFTMQLGDMVSRGVPRNYAAFFRQLLSVGPTKPYLTVIGNHDRRQPHGVSDSKLYRQLFGETDYFFDRGAFRFVVLDSSAGGVSAKQLAWLDKALDTPKKKIVFTHMPPAALRDWTDYGGVAGAAGFKEGSAAFIELVAERGVSRVYMGHVHGLAVKDVRGVRFVLSGGGGSPLYPAETVPAGVRQIFHHYLTVRVGPDGVHESVHRTNGAAFELPDPPAEPAPKAGS